MIYDVCKGKVIEDKFAMLNLDGIEKLSELSGSQINLLFAMAKEIANSDECSINMTPKRKRLLADEIGIKSTSSISNMMSMLKKLNIIKKIDPDEYPRKYAINPSILMFNNGCKKLKTLFAEK